MVHTSAYVTFICILKCNNCVIHYFAIVQVVAPSNFRYTSVMFDSITFQWNSLNGDQIQVDWYVVRCSRGNFSFIVSIIVATLLCITTTN